MRNLIVVNTYFQLITVINLCLNKLNNDKNDIILSDLSLNMEKIYTNLKKFNIFENVYFIKSKDICRCKNKFKKNFIHLFNRKKIIGTNVNNIYDCLLFYNDDILTYTLFDELLSRNQKLTCNRFEEGYSIYPSNFSNQTKSKLFFFIRRILNRKDLYKKISTLYLYNPDLLCYIPKCKVDIIPKLSRDDENLKKICNNIFNYKDDKNIMKKYIFFEESFFCDGYNINDLELVLKISEIVGKDNLLIKLHPRNSVDRFEKYGIKTIKAIEVPWEVIQLNNDFSNTVLLTITSGSVLSSRIFFDDNTKIYMLFNCTTPKSFLATAEYFKYLEKLRKKCGTNSINIPENLENFLNEIKN